MTGYDSKRQMAMDKLQEPAEYAGIQIWVGDARIVKHFTEMELHHARDHWMLMQIAAELCLAKLKEKKNAT